MERKREISVAGDLRKLSIPVIEGTEKEVVEELGNIFSHWDRVGLSNMKEAFESTRIILGVMVPDFVEPYAKLGEQVPIVIDCSPHENVWRGFRLNLGMWEWYADQGFKVVIFSRDFSKTISLEEYQNRPRKKLGWNEDE